MIGVRSVTQIMKKDERNDGCQRNMIVSRCSCDSRACYTGARMLPEQTRQAYQNYVTKLAQLNDRLRSRDSRLDQEEVESSRSLWIKLGKPIWKDALREFPLRGVPDAVALPGTGEGALIKFEDTGELIEAV